MEYGQEELRCISQVNDSHTDNGNYKRQYYSTENDIYQYDKIDIDESLLTPCEFCNRTFVPASLNKHRRGCYKAWLKQKDRDSKMEREKNRYQTPVGYNGEKPILTIEQMLAKRRQRRLNWRLRHEEFMRAVHAARDYADAVANGNPLPPPPPPVIEPDLKQCPHCQRRFHEKAIERHLTRCKEQSMRNNKERPSYQTMEAKRRLAVRLYYQPNSRPNSSLSMTNPPTPTSFSRPSSRQTDCDFGRNTDSPSDFNMGRYSSMSAIENNERKPQIPSSFFDNLERTQGRSLSRKSMRDFRSSQNTTPTFDSRNSTPIIPECYLAGRQSNLSTLSSRNSSRQSVLNTAIDSQFPQKTRNCASRKVDIYRPSGNLRRSASCLSQLSTPSVSMSEKRKTENPARGDILLSNRKPFNCGRSSSKESVYNREVPKQSIEIKKSNDNGNNVLKVEVKETKNGLVVSNHRSSSRKDTPKSPTRRSHTSNSQSDRIKSESNRTLTSFSRNDTLKSPTRRSHTSISQSEGNKPESNRTLTTFSRKDTPKSPTRRSHTSISQSEGNKPESSRTERTEHSKSHRSKKEINTPEQRLRDLVDKSDPVKTSPEISVTIRKSKHCSKLVNSDVDLSNLKSSMIVDKVVEDLERQNESKSTESTSNNRVRNEVQIRIQPRVKSKNSANKETGEDSSKISNSHITLQTPNIATAIQSKTNVSIIKDSDNILTIHKKLDSKGAVSNHSHQSKRFVTNCQLTKAEGDSTNINSQSTKIIQKEESGTNLNVTNNLYQCRSIRSVSISDKNNATKYRSSISLQDTSSRSKDRSLSSVVKATEIPYFCQECGHKFPSHNAKFCCSCGSKRSDISTSKPN